MFLALWQIIRNYLFVGAGIALFALPFFVIWRLRHRDRVLTGASHGMEQFFESAEANALVACWAAAEALVWFVIPEFLLLLVVFMRIRRKRQLLICDMLGTVCGTLVGMSGAIPLRFVAHAPYIQPAMFDQVKAWYGRQGVFGLVHQPFTGIPYKVFVAVAAQLHYNVVVFVAVAMVVRMCRYILAYVVFISIFPALGPYVRRHYVSLSLMAIFIFSALLAAIYRRYGLHYHVQTGGWF